MPRLDSYKAYDCSRSEKGNIMMFSPGIKLESEDIWFNLYAIAHWLATGSRPIE